jgi:predicted 2-oxoglutarate/Fe(II)-dependent dioxygenase YbiX
VLDPNLRVLAVFRFAPAAAATHAARVADYVQQLPRWIGARPAEGPIAPILICPRVLEPEFCRELIALYERHGGKESGVMRTDYAGRKTIGIMDRRAKSRRDYMIEEPEIRERILSALERRLFPEVRKAFQFRPSGVERYLIGCYSADEHGHFGSHRDNMTKMTSHRQFAVTLNLNAEEYEGGGLRFPEYDRRIYRPPTGSALVFSCTLMHEATPVTRGRRYCVLPFLENAEAAQVRLRREEWPGYRAPHLDYGKAKEALRPAERAVPESAFASSSAERR